MRVAGSRRAAKLIASLMFVVLFLGGCTAIGANGADQERTIALLLPESKTARYEAYDRPLFEAKVAELCPECEVIYANADQDPVKQQQQAESAFAQGISVLVLDPVDSSAAVTIVASALSRKIPVISYDRLIGSPELAFWVSFDNEKVGALQGKALVERLAADGHSSGNIAIINGSPTDNNARLFTRGAHSVIDGSAYTVVAEFDTPDWSPDKAQEWMASQVTQFGNSLIGVYAANDATAGGAIAALKAGGVLPLPPVTGQDAELTAIQRIVSGDQYMTIYKDFKREAEIAAGHAVALLDGKTLVGQSEETNGIPTTLLSPVIVTIDNIMETVVADGVYTVEQICTSEYAHACARAGIQ